MSGAALAAAAEALVGAPFRLHGRDPATGLDCIGLLAAALSAIGRPVDLPNGYTLRLRDAARWIPDPATLGFAAAEHPFAPGDTVLLDLGGGQAHLAVAGPRCDWVHAHAGIGRVVRSPALPEGKILGRWRLLREI